MPLSPDDPRPPYQQIADDLRQQIRSGRLASGEQLPSTVVLVKEYGVARNTVRSALRLLSDEGLVVARQGSGVFIRSDVPNPLDLPEAALIETLLGHLATMGRDLQALGDRVAELERRAEDSLRRR